MGKARKNRVVVDFDILEKRMAVIGISKASISKQLGYSTTWLIGAKKNGGRLRTKDAKDVCDLLGLNPEDVIVKHDVIAQKPPQNAPEAQQEDDTSDMEKAIDKQAATLNARINSLSEDLKQIREIDEKQRLYLYQIGVLLQEVIDIMGR